MANNQLRTWLRTALCLITVSSGLVPSRICSSAYGAVGSVEEARSRQDNLKSSFTCPVTSPNGKTYTDAQVELLHRHGTPSRKNLDGTQSLGNHGNDALSTLLSREGKVVFKPGGAGFILEDGALSMKFWWWRLVMGQLRIDGRRLDGSAPPLRAAIPDGYGDIGFQATALIFPTVGCWEVTGHVGKESLTFVTLVERLDKEPRK